MVWDVLEAILRTTIDESQLRSVRSISSPSTGSEGIQLHEPWVANPANAFRVWDAVESHTLYDSKHAEHVTATFKPLHVTPGPQRKPPNLHPAIIYYSPPNSIPLTDESLPTKRYDVPNVPNAFMLSNILTHDECLSLIKMAEAREMIADQPAGGSAINMVSVILISLFLFSTSNV